MRPAVAVAVTLGSLGNRQPAAGSESKRFPDPWMSAQARGPGPEPADAGSTERAGGVGVPARHSGTDPAQARVQSHVRPVIHSENTFNFSHRIFTAYLKCLEVQGK